MDKAHATVLHKGIDADLVINTVLGMYIFVIREVSKADLLGVPVLFADMEILVLATQGSHLPPAVRATLREEAQAEGVSSV